MGMINHPSHVSMIRAAFQGRYYIDGSEVDISRFLIALGITRDGLRPLSRP